MEHRLILHYTQRESAAAGAPATTKASSRTADYSAATTTSSIDTNKIIILAILLFALICALGLNFIVRCALRCSTRLALQTPADHHHVTAAVRLAGGTRGLKKSSLRRIPVAVYSPGGGGGMIRTTDCMICLGEFVGGDKIRVLPKCNHGFHVPCIDAWLLSHSSCPTCRQSLVILEESTTSSISEEQYSEEAVVGSESSSITIRRNN